MHTRVPSNPPRPTPYEIAAKTDALLRTLAREEVLVSRRVGQALVRLATLDGFAALGYSSLASYAGQQLGISGHAAQELAWMERRLQRYPAIDAAYADGRLSFSHARLLLRAVKPEDEMLWAEAATKLSVAELEQAIEDWKERGLTPACEDETAGAVPLHAPEDEPRAHRIRYLATPAQAVKLDLAVELVRRACGAELPMGACLEFMMAEFLTGAGFPGQAVLKGEDADSNDVPGEVLPWRVPGIGKIRRMWREIELGLAEFTDHWDALCWAVPPVDGPSDAAPLQDPSDIDRHLREVARRDRQREVHFAQLLGLMKEHTLYEILDFTSVAHYVADRLMFSPRSAWTLLAVERRTRALPLLWQAYEGGILTKAQVLLVGNVARAETQSAWIEHARRTTLKFLREDVKAATRLRVLDPEQFERTGGLLEAPRTAAPEGAKGVQAGAANARAGAPCVEVGGAGVRVGAPERVQACADEAVAQGPEEAADSGRVQACAAGAAAQGAESGRLQGDADEATVSESGEAAEWGRVQGCASTEDATFHAADVARLPVAERLRMFRRGDLGEIEETRPTRHTFYLPHALVEMWREVVRTCRVLFGEFVTVADCIEACVDAYLEEHGRAALEAIRRHQVLDRDGWLCANPTCPRRSNLNEHHLTFRSRGGSDEPSNLIGLCETCHLRLVHRGRIHVHGKAPDEIVWELGVAAGREPHLEVVGRRIVGGSAAA